MNRHFTNITEHMKLTTNKISHPEELVNIWDTLKNHKSVPRIKLAIFHAKSTLKFSKVSENEVKKKNIELLFQEGN